MSRIAVVGNATLDIINRVDEYPREDQEVRALSQRISRGGNAANTLVVLAQLGNDCSWLGTLAEDPDAQFILDDLGRYQIDTTMVQRTDRGKVPTSYINVSEASGSRTIVHYRDQPELSFEHFEKWDLSGLDWIHFEGRNIDELEKMLQHCQSSFPALPRSLEVEKPREGIEALFPLADLLLFSHDYATQSGHQNAQSLLEALRQNKHHYTATCTWGAEGAYALSSTGRLVHQPAHELEKVVDTLAAGDTFNAGMIDAGARGERTDKALEHAVRLAGMKCAQEGLDGLLKE